MRARSSLERLANAGRPLLDNADALVDAGDWEQILERIVASERHDVRSRRPLVIALVTAVAICAAVAAVVMHGNAAPRATTAGGHPHIALTGAGIQMAGYHFRTPAGFTSSSNACAGLPDGFGLRDSSANGSAAAAADGGCVKAFYVIGGNLTQIVADASPVAVGSHQGYYVAPDASGQSRLYVPLPQSGSNPAYLALFAQDLTEDQLVAIAESGLPANP